MVLDLSESGKQIGEKLFVLLNIDQQREIVQYVLNRERQPDNPYITSGLTDTRPPLTEIRDGDLYFCLEERKVCICGQEIGLTAKEFDAFHLLIINRRRVLTFETIAYR